MADKPTIDEFVGVYDANGTIRGELAYLVRRATGCGHCALCDISHGALRRRPAFDRAVARLPVPIWMLHRDELDAEQAAAATGSIPCVLAVGSEGVVVLVDRTALEHGPMDAERLVDAILERASAAGQPSPRRSPLREMRPTTCVQRPRANSRASALSRRHRRWIDTEELRAQTAAHAAQRRRQP
ncbi:MAG: hypothetical protein ACRD0V_05620 [Acidimicrobiales bacterium]